MPREYSYCTIGPHNLCKNLSYHRANIVEYTRLTIQLYYFLQNTDRAKEDIKLALGVLNQHLLTRTYLVGERITLADIAVACNLLNLYQLVSHFSDLSSFVEVVLYSK